jgi:hypothetical protein
MMLKVKEEEAHVGKKKLMLKLKEEAGAKVEERSS